MKLVCETLSRHIGRPIEEIGSSYSIDAIEGFTPSKAHQAQDVGRFLTSMWCELRYRHRFLLLLDFRESALQIEDLQSHSTDVVFHQSEFSRFVLHWGPSLIDIRLDQRRRSLAKLKISNAVFHAGWSYTEELLRWPAGKVNP